MDFFWNSELFLRKSFFMVIFKLSYKTNILINFLFQACIQRETIGYIKYIEYIFLFLVEHKEMQHLFIFCCCLPFFVYFLSKKIPKWKFYSIQQNF